MKHKLLIWFCAVLLILGTLPALSVAAAEGSIKVSAGKSTVAIGDTVSVTVTYQGGSQKIASIEADIAYSANNFELISTSTITPDGGKTSGDAGAIRLIFSMPNSGILPSEAKYVFTFKATAVGDLNFSISTTEFKGTTDITNLVFDDLAASNKTLSVIASNPTQSGNANLKSLITSYGPLSPNFSPDVTEYTISVDHTVTSMPLTFYPEDENATTSIEGSKALPEGATKHTRIITVTAPNGTTKKYTLVILRSPAPSTNTTTTNTTTTSPTESTTPGDSTIPGETTTTTSPTPSEDALEVEVDGAHLTILDTEAPVDLPEGFAWDTLSVNGIEVPAAIHGETDMILLYLVAENADDCGLYIYDIDNDAFHRYIRLSVQGGDYLLYNLPDGQIAPAGTIVSRVTIGTYTVSAYRYEDGALNDFSIVWAAPINGTAGWYTYDQKEGTFQRYHVTPGEGAPTTTQKSVLVTGKSTNSQETGGKQRFSLASALKEPRNVILFGGVALVTVVIVITVILLILSLSKNKGGKH